MLLALILALWPCRGLLAREPKSRKTFHVKQVTRNRPPQMLGSSAHRGDVSRETPRCAGMALPMDGAEEHHLPIQNWLKITSRMSSTSTRPSSRPSEYAAARKSSATSSSPCP